MWTPERSRLSLEHHYPNKKGEVSTDDINAGLNQINLESTIIRIQKDNENVIELFGNFECDSRASVLSCEGNLDEFSLPDSMARLGLASP